MSDYPEYQSPEHPDEALSDLVNGELDGAEARRVAVHAATCARCAQLLGGLFAARAALRFPEPAHVTVPRAFWRHVRSRLDEVDGLIRATNQPLAQRSRWTRPALAAGLIAIVMACMVRIVVFMRPDPIARVADMHMAATAPLADPGLHQAVGYSPVSRWQLVSRNVSNLGGHMVLQSVYDVDGLPVSVFRLPAGAFDESRLVQVTVGQESVYLGVLHSSSLAAIPIAGAWEIMVARTPVDDLLRLAMARPREVELGPRW